MLTVAHSSMNPLHPTYNDCVSIICRHSSGCWTNRGEHGGCVCYTSNLQGEHGEGEPKKVFASLPGMNLVYNLALILIYTNSFRQERKEHLEISSPGAMGHSLWHRPHHSSPPFHTKHPVGRNHPRAAPPQLLFRANNQIGAGGEWVGLKVLPRGFS